MVTIPSGAIPTDVLCIDNPPFGKNRIARVATTVSLFLRPSIGCRRAPFPPRSPARWIHQTKQARSVLRCFPSFPPLTKTENGTTATQCLSRRKHVRPPKGCMIPPSSMYGKGSHSVPLGEMQQNEVCNNSTIPEMNSSTREATASRRILHPRRM